MPTQKIEDRFPLTLGFLAFFGFAIITEPLLGLSAVTYPVISAFGILLFAELIGGVVLLLVLSLIFTGGFGLVKPDKPFERYNATQAGIVALGFALVSVWQIYVNQAVLSTVLSTTPSQIVVDPATQEILKLDSAISEEGLFGPITIAVFVTLVYFGVDRVLAAVATLPPVAYSFVLFHQYTLQAIQDKLGAIAANQAWYFFFGARLVLSGVLLGTLWFSGKPGRLKTRVASLVAPVIIHFTWNLVGS